VSFTDQAQLKIREFLSQAPEKGLRIFLENGRYALGLDTRDAEDVVFSYEGFQLFIDPKSMKYVTGLVVDYVEDEGGPAFELSNAFSGDGGCREGRGACGCNKNKIH
jgi:iron-sulfur cluster assembly accessory protein